MVPHYYLSVELDLTALLALREQLNSSIRSGKGKEISVLDFFVKASALAMKQVRATIVSTTLFLLQFKPYLPVCLSLG